MYLRKICTILNKKKLILIKEIKREHKRFKYYLKSIDEFKYIYIKAIKGICKEWSSQSHAFGAKKDYKEKENSQRFLTMLALGGDWINKL